MLGTGLLYLISLLPFFILYRIADILFLITYYIIGYRRSVVRENLQSAFPEKTKAERLAIEKKYFRYLADLIVESIKLCTISTGEVQKRIHIVNMDLIESIAFKQGRSVIGAVGHYGNWEMGGLRLSLLTDKRRIIVYKPLSNKIFDRFFFNMRSRFGATLVPMKSTFRKLVEYRHEVTFTVLAGDQTPSREEVQYFMPFLNQPTAVFSGVEKLAKAVNSVVVFCDVRRIKRGYYNCTFVPLFEEPKLTAEHEITHAHVQYLEKVIKEEPQYWLWSHRRWKFKPENMNR